MMQREASLSKSLSAAEGETLNLQSADWRDDVLLRLVGGHDSGEIAAARADISKAELDEFMEEIRSSPLFRFCQVTFLRWRSREWYLRVLGQLASDEYSEEILETRSSVTRERFLMDFYYRNRPLHLKAVSLSWPAITKWTSAYLKTSCGDVEVEIMTNRGTAKVEEQNTSDHLRKKMPFRNFVDLVDSVSKSNDYYLVSRNRFFEETANRPLLDDLGSLPFVDTHSDGNGVRMWFGPGGTITPLHHDDRNNVIVQIKGRKIVRLYPAVAADLMQQTMPWYAGIDPELDSATSGISVPAVSMVLEPGDALFIPAGWWHALEALDVSITLAFVDFGVPNEYGRP